MRILRNLLTALKGGASEVGEKIVDSQSLRIFEQKIRESDALLEKSTKALTVVMANRTLVDNEINTFKTLLAENDGYIKSCLKKGENDLARDIAEKIGELETELKAREIQKSDLVKAEIALNTQRKKMLDQINHRKRQIVLFTAQSNINEALKKTADAVGEDFSPELGDMAALAKIIEEKQRHELAQLTAAEALYREDSGQDLQDKLIDAGVKQAQKPSVDEILSRYNAKKLS